MANSAESARGIGNRNRNFQPTKPYINYSMITNKNENRSASSGKVSPCCDTLQSWLLRGNRQNHEKSAKAVPNTKETGTIATSFSLIFFRHDNQKCTNLFFLKHLSPLFELQGAFIMGL